MRRLMSRRTLLGALPATLAAPALLAQTPPRPDDLTTHAGRLDQLRTLIITIGGQTRFANAFGGRRLDQSANIKSVSKTVLATLTGIAIDRGILEGADQRVLPVLGRAPFGDARDDLTIGDLLSMRAGLESTSGENYGAWIASRDWVDYALTRDLVSRPGGRFIYSTGSWHILGAALSQASGLSLLEMARAWLGAPMGIAFPPWVQDRQGRYLGGNEMAMTPGDLARIGELVLNEGRVGDEQVVSAEWIRTSWQPRGRSRWSGDAYGYGWFLTSFAGQQACYGRGYGGQMLVVVPALDMSISITSDPTLPARSGGYFSDLRALVDHAVADFATA